MASSKSANIEQAWQSILDHLRREIPKASFNAWVQDTRVVSYVDSVITIAAHNAYARDWLESRISSTASRLLIGILNAEVALNFIVADNESDDAIDIVDTKSETASPIPNNEVEISAQEFDSVYEQVVRPDRAVYLPGYFRRWLKVTGPDLAWMYVAYRQAAYTAGGRKDSISNRFSGDVIANLCGVTERAYWKRLANSSTWQKLNGLVRIIDTGKEWDRKSSTPKQLPRRYTVAMTLPLTPADATSLRKWITANMETSGGPEAVLRAAIATPLDELIPADVKAKDGDEPATIRKLIRDLFKDQLDEKLLNSLASTLQNHIMVPNDLIVITVFFLENILRHLGAGPAWMLTILRDQCYVDPKSGEARNRVTIKEGYKEIAAWLGMTRPKTIWEWLNEKFSEGHEDARKYKNAVLLAYMAEIAKEEPALDFEGQPRTFEVLLEDVPQEIIQIALTKPEGMVLSEWCEVQSRNGAIFSQAMARSSDPNGAMFSQAMALYSDSVGAKFIVLALNSLKPSSLNSLKTTTSLVVSDDTDIHTCEKTAVVAVPSVWDFGKLLKINNVNPKIQKTLREHGATSQELIAYLLYGFSKQNSRINAPLSFAIDLLRNSDSSEPGEKFMALAALPPRILIGMIAGENFDNPLASTWRALMGSEFGTPRFRGLLPILLGDAAPASEELLERRRTKPRKKTDLELALENFEPRKKEPTGD